MELKDISILNINISKQKNLKPQFLQQNISKTNQ